MWKTIYMQTPLTCIEVHNYNFWYETFYLGMMLQTRGGGGGGEAGGEVELRKCRESFTSSLKQFTLDDIR
jgi:hypothetical protein